MTEANPKWERAVDAAGGVFLRYGYDRATMNDIAEAAKMSRPALYLLFSNKEQIFSAVMTRENQKRFTAIRQGLPNYVSLEDRLYFACEEWSAKGYDLLTAYPDAKDLFNLDFIPVQQAYAGFQDIIAEILVAAIPHWPLDFTPAELARSLAFAIRGYKDAVASGDELRRLIRLHIRLIIAFMGFAHTHQGPQALGSLE